MSSAEFTSRSITRSDSELIKRLSTATLLVLAFVALFDYLYLLYSHKFFDRTGSAEWLWDKRDIIDGDPAAFFVSREFDLSHDRYYTKIKIAADPRYTLWFNGREVGDQLSSDPMKLDVYDVSTLARDQKNRIVVALRSTNGVGGLLASVDTSHESQNVIVTDKSWHVFRRWWNDLVSKDPTGVEPTRPKLYGMPPMRRWGYLSEQPASLFVPFTEIMEPVGRSARVAALPKVEIVSGTAIRTSVPMHAVVFDFGASIDARLRLKIVGPSFPTSHVVHVRFANETDDLASVEGAVVSLVFAPGERLLADSTTRHFRYAMIYAEHVDAEAMK